MSKPHEERHRQAVFAHLSAEIQREAIDAHTLAAAGDRALYHPEAVSDPILAGMLRAYISGQESLIRDAHPESAPSLPVSHLAHAFEGQRVSPHMPTRAELREKFHLLDARLEQHCAEFDEVAAAAVVERMHELRRRYPVHIEPQRLEACERRLVALRERRSVLSAQVERLSEQARVAARAEDHKTASWLVRRVWAVHAMFPALVSEETARACRDQIGQIAEEREHREAARAVLARERAVANEIKQLATIIRGFQRATQGMATTHEAYRRAEAEYRDAVRRVREHDSEWLMGLMLELQTLLEDMDDTSGRAEVQVDRFLASVRAALANLRHDLRDAQSADG